MGLQINTNVMAINAQRNLSMTNNKLGFVPHDGPVGGLACRIVRQ